jgi:flagellar hook protein FlgE
MTQNLDSQSAIGAQTTGQIQVYDSLGSQYEANVTYTNQGNNTWSYSVTVPNTLQGNTNVVAGVTQLSYNFGSSGGTLATVDPGTNLTITGPTASGSATITAPTVVAGETLATYKTAVNAAITAAGITGTTATSTAGGLLVISGKGISTAGSLMQDPVASANASGTLTFNSSGNLVSPGANVSGMTFAGLSDGAATMNLNFNLFGPGGTGNISQTAAASSTSATDQNGYSSGQYEGFAISGTGVIAASYSNGQTQNVGQLAIATISNEQGLVNLGSTEYQATAASGSAAVGVAGSGGRGTIAGSSLEASNVNISAEFSDLIVAQRAFEANSKAVTTFDSVTEETINMIH